MLKNKLKKSISAFTFIELSIVLVVIAFIVSVVVGGQKVVELARLAHARQLTNNATFVQKKNLVLWLEPTLKNSFQDINGVNVILDNEDSVVQWVNQADTYMNPVQATSSNQPMFISDGIGKIPTLRFDGNDYLEFASDSIVTMNPSEFTMFIVCSVSGGMGTWRSPLTSRSIESPGASGYIFYVNISDDWIFWTGNGSSWDKVGNTVDVIENKTYVVNAIKDSSTSSLYVNNALTGSQSITLSRNKNYPARVGAGRTESSAAYNWNGDISEVIIFNKALSDNDRNEIYDYLAEKYGTE
jgi:hypothetical protein